MDFEFPSHGYKDVFYNSVAPMLIIATDAPAYTMLDVNNAYLFATHTKREIIANRIGSLSKNIEHTITLRYR
jgi:hypothetical protein